MSGKTKIPWADKVWNPVVGCTPVSAGCAHCYAKRIYSRFYQDKPFSQVQLHPERLEEPWHWKKPSRIFVNSMSDLFHEDVPDEFIHRVFSHMYGSPHTFMILTKRPDRMKKFADRVLADCFSAISGVFPNVWLGVTAENQQAVDERIPLLLETPAAVRFVSIEPMLGPVDITGYLNSLYILGDVPENTIYEPGLHWVICGGETGPGARPMHHDWVRDLRDQCLAAGVPFFFKSWGEWETAWPSMGLNAKYHVYTFSDGQTVYRTGKKRAGRLIDGQEWNEFPEVGR